MAWIHFVDIHYDIRLVFDSFFSDNSFGPIKYLIHLILFFQSTDNSFFEAFTYMYMELGDTCEIMTDQIGIWTNDCQILSPSGPRPQRSP